MSRRRLRSWLVGTLLVISAGLLAAWQARDMLLSFAIDQAVAASGGRLTIERTRGDLLAAARIDRLQWRDPQGLQIDLRDLRWRVRWPDLLAGRLVVSELVAADLQVRLGGGASPSQAPVSMALPLPVALPVVRVSHLLIVPLDGPPIVLRDLALRADYVPGYGGAAGRYRIERLDLRSPWGLASARFNLGDQAPFPLEASASGRLDWQGLAWELGLNGTLNDVRWHARASPGPEAVATPAVSPPVLSASGVLTPFRPRLLGPVALGIDGLAPGLLGLSSVKQGRIDGSGELNWRSDAPGEGVSVRLALRNRQPAPFDQGGLPLSVARAELIWRGGIWRINSLQAQAGGAGQMGQVAAQTTSSPSGQLSGEIEIDPARTVVLPWFSVPRVRGTLQLSQIDARWLDSRLPAGRLSGSLRLDERSLVLALVSGGREGLSLQAAGVLEGDRLVLSRFEAAAASRLAGARVQAQGAIQVVAPWAFSGEGRFTGIEIAALQALAGRAQVTPLTGELGGHWQMAGALRDPALGLLVQGSLAVDRGSVQGQALRASASARVAGGHLERALLRLEAGPNRLQAEGAAGRPGDTIRYRLDAPAIAPLAALAGLGALSGAVTAEGIWHVARDQPALSVEATASGLRGPGFRVARTSISGRLDAGNMTLAAQASELSAAGLTVDRANLQASGSVQDHVVRIDLHRDRQQLAARFSGGIIDAARDTSPGSPGSPGSRWQGVLQELLTTGPLAGRLLAPATLTLGAQSVRVGPARFEGVLGTIGVSHLSWQPGRWALAGEAVLTRLASTAHALGLGSLALPNGIDPDAVRVDLRADLSGSSARDPSGTLNLKMTPPPGFRGALDADVQLREGRLDGRVSLELPTLALANRWLGPAWSVDGRLSLAGRVSGSLVAPRLTGDVIGEALALEQRALGWRLGAGTLAARFEGDRLTVASLRLFSGQQAIDAAITRAVRPDTAASTGLPPGAIELSGTVALADRGGQFRLRAVAARIPLGPGQRLVVSGDAEVTSRANLVELKGQLQADEGLIELRGGDAPALPDDVEIVAAGAGGVSPVRGLGEAATQPAVAGLKVLSELRIELGDRLRVRGSGVDARLTGTVALRGTFPDAPRAFGTVRVRDGTYAAYGQQLQIERGRVVFNGALDNPVLDIVALRRNLPVEAGVALQGTVLAPRVRLTSRPDVVDAEKLSWLVLGVPLEGAQSGAQSAALQAAAASLFGGNDGGLARTLGVDLLTVRSASAGDSLIAAPGLSGFTAAGLVPGQVASPSVSAGTSATAQSVMAIGKRLNSRLLVTYEQGLRGVWNLLRIQYDITSRLSLRAQTGSESAIDVLYRLSFD